MILARQAIREDIERINRDTGVKKSVVRVKTNIDPETKPGLRAALPSSLLAQLSRSLALALFSLILSHSVPIERWSCRSLSQPTLGESGTM